MKLFLACASPWLLAAAAGAQTFPSGTSAAPQPGTTPPATGISSGGLQRTAPRDCSLPPLPEGAPTGWPGGVVYFEFDANVNAIQRYAMLEAMDAWNYSGARVAFVPRTAGVNASYLHIENGAGNFSNTIFFFFVSATFEIYNWDYAFIMAHELCHALGFWHEQARPDRDTFVTIVPGNICCSQASQFNIVSNPNWFPILTPYDFDSVMHYDQCSFTTCSSCTAGCETILCDPPYTPWQGLIGQRDHLSSNDIADMQNAYGAGLGPRYVVPGYALFQTGSMRNPYWTIARVNTNAPAGSTIYVQSGVYDEGIITINKQMTLTPFEGVVTLR